jgi:hypothetical protein
LFSGKIWYDSNNGHNDKEDAMIEQATLSSVTPEKKTYTQPVLVEYGDLITLTQAGSGGLPDLPSGSGFGT